MASPRNPYLRLHSYFLHIPFLRTLGERLHKRYGPQWPSVIRGLFVFCWMWRVQFYWRSERLGLIGDSSASCWSRGWCFFLMIPFCSLSCCWKYSPPDEWDRLITSLVLMWKPVRWWNVSEGSMIFEREWRKVWGRWQRREWYIAESWGARKVCWLEKDSD
jgi:hypothetical protein